VADLAAGEQHVNRHADRAERRDSEQHLRPLVTVAHQHRHAVARLHAGAVQPAREPQRAVAQRRERALVALERHRWALAVDRARGALEHLEQVHGRYPPSTGSSAPVV
jgi:hypothetical protein